MNFKRIKLKNPDFWRDVIDYCNEIRGAVLGAGIVWLVYLLAFG